jgi:hypothetical protein
MEGFILAHNPDENSSLPYLVGLPIEGGIFFKTREAWPRASRSYCHRIDTWPENAEVIEEVAVKVCRRRGAAIDLVLDRRANYRSQFVFTRSRGREVVLWQTAKVARQARPGARVPRRSAPGLENGTIYVDTRERYPYRFGQRQVATERRKLSVGDYAVVADDVVVAVVERKTMENLSADLVSGKLGFVMAELTGLQAAAVVVEGRYTELFKSEWVEKGWLPDLVARLQVRYPSVPIVFCENRKFAEEWTYRFLAAAAQELTDTKTPREG